jgi:hypothetical protein
MNDEHISSIVEHPTLPPQLSRLIHLIPSLIETCAIRFDALHRPRPRAPVHLHLPNEHQTLETGGWRRGGTSSPVLALSSPASSSTALSNQNLSQFHFPDPSQSRSQAQTAAPDASQPTLMAMVMATASSTETRWSETTCVHACAVRWVGKSLRATEVTFVVAAVDSGGCVYWADGEVVADHVD